MERELPDFFLTDLPREAALTPAIIADACETLRRNRLRYLRDRSTESLVATFGGLAEKWLDDRYPLRQLALAQGESRTQYPAAVIRRGLDELFSSLTKDGLERLILQDLGHLRRLDDPVSDELERRAERKSFALGPELIAHVPGGAIPNPTVTGLILGFLVRSAQFVKCAEGASFLIRLFAHSVYETDPKLGACLELADWRGGDRDLETPLWQAADCVVAMGSDETMRELEKQLPCQTRFLPYGHRVSFVYLTKAGLVETSPRNLVAGIVDDVVRWNQSGCLSPQVIYVENGTTPNPEQLTKWLADELASREASEPRGKISDRAAGRIANSRRLYEIRAASSTDTVVYASRGSTAWTVVLDHEPRFQGSCVNRFLHVKAVENLDEVLGGAEEVRGQVSCVGLVAAATEAPALVRRLARWGVTRVCPVGRMQTPPIVWRHDGRPSLGDLVTWADWEL